MLVLPQRAQIKSIKQMKFLSTKTQNRWKFVIANVRGAQNNVTSFMDGPKASKKKAQGSGSVS